MARARIQGAVERGGDHHHQLNLQHRPQALLPGQPRLHQRVRVRVRRAGLEAAHHQPCPVFPHRSRLEPCDRRGEPRQSRHLDGHHAVDHRPDRCRVELVRQWQPVRGRFLGNQPGERQSGQPQSDLRRHEPDSGGPGPKTGERGVLAQLQQRPLRRPEQGQGHSGFRRLSPWPKPSAPPVRHDSQAGAVHPDP